ncbi:MAG: hypothetical protein A2157_13530 [Deltaproteobacteria bacterium RBG_16_47_11]|nr:MAG: hypothetical protein A2157_13530 [Deltaproteobacteria bacterium RBG_16_47_11]
MVAEPEVFALVFAVAELSPEVVVLVVEPEVVFVVDLEVVEPGVVLVVDLEVSEPGVVFVALVSAADVAEPQASVGIPVVFDVLLPVSVVGVEVDSSGRPKFLAFPNVDHFASSSSSVEVVGQESVHNSIDVHANHDLCSILSNLGLHQNKILEHCHNNSNPGHNNVSDTNDLPMDATTTHSRKRGLRQCQGRRKHTCPVSLSQLVVREIGWGAAEET